MLYYFVIAFFCRCRRPVPSHFAFVVGFIDMRLWAACTSCALCPILAILDAHDTIFSRFVWLSNLPFCYSPVYCRTSFGRTHIHTQKTELSNKQQWKKWREQNKNFTTNSQWKRQKRANHEHCSLCTSSFILLNNGDIDTYVWCSHSSKQALLNTTGWEKA